MVGKVELKSTASNAKLEVTGTVTDVVVSADSSSIKVEDTGSISSVSAKESAKALSIDVTGKASIKSVNSAAQDTVISGEGRVDAVTGATTNKGNTSNTGSGSSGNANAGSGGSGNGGGSDGGSGNGGSGDGGSDNGNGSGTDEGQITYRTDTRFAADYPIVELGKDVDNNPGSQRNVMLRIKLKDGIASPSSPVKVYYVITSDNTSHDASSESVIHGHLGINTTDPDGSRHHNIIWASRSGVVTLTGSEEKVVTESMYYNGQEGMKIYFVIKSSVETSAVPTRIAFSKETGSSFGDTTPPLIYNAFWSEPVVEGENSTRTVRIITSEVLDTAKTVSGNAFTVSGVTGSSITVVNLHKNDKDYYVPYSDWIDLTLVYPTESDLNALQITYVPELGGITDIANIPNRMESFTLFRQQPIDFSYVDKLIQDATPKIDKLFVSEDGKYLTLHLSPRFVYFDYSIRIDADEQKLGEWDHVPVTYSTDYSEQSVYAPGATGKASRYTITLSPNGGKDMYDVVDKKYDIFKRSVEPTPYNEVKAASAVLDLGQKTLSLEIIGDIYSTYYLMQGCQYVLTIDGIPYRLRGESGYVSSYKRVFGAECLESVDFSKVNASSVVTLSFDSLSTAKNSDALAKDFSGKPIDPSILKNLQVIVK